jgi:hypothetical protein
MGDVCDQSEVIGCQVAGKREQRPKYATLAMHTGRALNADVDGR